MTSAGCTLRSSPLKHPLAILSPESHCCITSTKDQLARRRTDLPAHVVQFTRFLRGKGFRCGPRETSDAVAALSYRAPRSALELEALLRATLAKNRREYQRFPDLYRAYFRELERAENDKRIEKPVTADKPARRPPTLQELKSWLYNGRQTDEAVEMAAFSPGEAFGQKDFSAFATDELDELRRLLRRFARQLDLASSRRFKVSREAAAIDFRKTIRAAGRRGGVVEELHWRRRKPQPKRLTILCDVSKSMDLYARFLVQLLYGFQRAFAKIETFVFATELTRVTPALRDPAFRDGLNRLSELVPDWSGGTNLGRALTGLRQGYGRRYLGRRTTTLIISDGWDQGPPADMDAGLRWLSKHSKRLLWINPLAGQPGFSPSTTGMRLADKYAEGIYSAHNLDTLRALLREL